jgi:colanic acid biosynthesis glycosyl transferase WcaI
VGHSVTVIASRRAYDNPGVRFPSREEWNGVKINRIPCTGFGKASKWRRMADFVSFLVSCGVHLTIERRYDAVIAMTSPPLISFLATLFVKISGGALIFWVMDLNPDEAIAAGWMRPRSFAARILSGMLQSGLQRAERIIVLDRFMRSRIESKGIPSGKIEVIPPWSHDDYLRYDLAGRSRFREQHKLANKFVIMYSGNHSPCHPLDTLLDAALELSTDPEFAFCFVGGGKEFGKVKDFATRHKLVNIICLPYQKFKELSASLSAADLHVVVLGDPFVGIVHPSKVYNVLALGIPFLYIGPDQSHVGDMMISDTDSVWSYSARHKDSKSVVRQIRIARARSVLQCKSELQLAQRFSQNLLVKSTIGVINTAAARVPEIPQNATSPV